MSRDHDHWCFHVELHTKQPDSGLLTMSKCFVPRCEIAFCGVLTTFRTTTTGWRHQIETGLLCMMRNVVTRHRSENQTVLWRTNWAGALSQDVNFCRTIESQPCPLLFLYQITCYFTQSKRRIGVEVLRPKMWNCILTKNSAFWSFHVTQLLDDIDSWVGTLSIGVFMLNYIQNNPIRASRRCLNASSQDVKLHFD
jgi:hypothetical protein